jgi:hypothetical protein
MGHRLGVCLALSLLLIGGCGSKSGPEKQLSDLQDVRDAMCACPDQKDSTDCMREARKKLHEWTATYGDVLDMRTSKLTEEQGDRVVALRSEITQCCMKADWSGGTECIGNVPH